MGPTRKQKILFLLARHLSGFLPSVAARVALELFLTPDRVARPESEKNWFEKARKYQRSDGTAMFEWGPETGPIVALVHGWSGRGTQLAAFAEPLAAQGYRVIAFDGPAHGASPGKETNVGAFSLFLVQLQKELGPFKAAIAHSFGSGATVVAASRGLQVERLVLVAGPARYERVVQFFLDYLKMSRPANEKFKAFLQAKVGLPAQELSIGELGHRLQVPVLVIHDRGDKEVRFISAEEIHQAWHGSELMETEGLGHRRILKDAKVIERTVEFITRK